MEISSFNGSKSNFYSTADWESFILLYLKSISRIKSFGIGILSQMLNSNQLTYERAKDID